MDEKCARIFEYPGVPGSTTRRASLSASIMGSEYGGEERMEDTVDLPVAIEPVRPRSSIVV